MSWVFIDNPAFAGQAPRPLKAACHDGSPFLTIRCDCGTDMHLHESQIRRGQSDNARPTLWEMWQAVRPDPPHDTPLPSKAAIVAAYDAIQSTGYPWYAAIGTYCKGCGRLLRFEPGELAGAFARLRELGWIE